MEKEKNMLEIRKHKNRNCEHFINQRSVLRKEYQVKVNDLVNVLILQLLQYSRIYSPY